MNDHREISVTLDSDAAHAYERILNELEQQQGQPVEIDEHAERILRKYIADEYRKLILNGSATTEIPKLAEE
ncbi:hypothetical protein SY89_03077 [Halolamina pelagica]|uniref:Uncharacterized protein n=1 Tax=Halolamina pelagica TaxID=699431 RepID=A0A0P7FYG8_9EURY|nr:hypothetical protein [Halolamina pelagica]KPN32309.1 hypothetical protein SY89_03077 [Halolamina pelagica]